MTEICDNCGIALPVRNTSGLCRKHSQQRRDALLHLKPGWAEHRTEVRRKYEAANSEKIAAHRAEYNKIHSAENAARARRWRLDNAEYNKSRLAVWNSANPDKAYARREKRRMMAQSLFVETVVKSQVLYTGGEVCHLCGWMVDPDDWDVDHVIPISWGGPHCYDNVAVSHPECNRKKKNRFTSPIRSVERKALDAFWAFHVGAL